MTLKIKFFAYFRDLFGARERDLVLESAATVGGVLEVLTDTPERRAEVFAGAELKPHVVLLLNGAPPGRGLSTPLADGDTLAIFPLLGGG
ncbi:MAG TPA: MoaD/ThiS family protein [Candidatus Aminicenantes bacterium]|nr:MoaD/ThiS family protein [Candidatus Aminicenantes bacterium]HRY64698.1 MoaD/ThiS family protein [Candidatus Aminicenantes bacterium]HRZ71611.1 MoaD/ThiS family protein [Candidatus Aminicenantes bacterium]